jgi:hypothetical protein
MLGICVSPGGLIVGVAMSGSRGSRTPDRFSALIAESTRPDTSFVGLELRAPDINRRGWLPSRRLTTLHCLRYHASILMDEALRVNASRFVKGIQEAGKNGFQFCCRTIVDVKRSRCIFRCSNEIERLMIHCLAPSTCGFVARAE